MRCSSCLLMLPLLGLGAGEGPALRVDSGAPGPAAFAVGPLGVVPGPLVQRLGPPGGPSWTWTDEFNGNALGPSWSLHNAGLMQHSVSGGELHLRALQGGGPFAWFADEEGPLVYRSVTGDFSVTARIRAEDPNNPGQPPPAEYRLGGIIARDPASSPGDRNSVHVVLGSGSNAFPIAAEDKSTDDSTSNFVFHGISEARGVLRLDRNGDQFSMHYRPYGGSWQLLRSHLRPDLPQKLDVGLMVYAFSAPADVEVHFDQVRFSGG